MRVLSVIAAVHVGFATPILASNLDSEHLFGLTEGSDIGTPGERELEFELAARAGKRSGAYRVLSQASALKLTLTDSFRVSPIVGFDHHRIRGVPGLDDRSQWTLGELAFEMKYRVLDRRALPFGLTFGATPTFAHIDEVGGERVDGYGMKVSAMADRELIADRLLAAINLGFSPEAGRSHATGAWEHESSFTASAAISARLTERVFVSGETRYERAYEGLALDRFAGHALFAGPAIYARLADNAWIGALWNAQISGRATGISGALDLTNFERHLVKFRLGIQF